MTKNILWKATALAILTVAIGASFNFDLASADDQKQRQDEQIWIMPLEPPTRLVNPYRQPSSDYSAGHRGVDLVAKVGETVIAPADGRIWFSGKVVNRQVLSILHTNGYLTEFEPVCSDFSAGQAVRTGDLIGFVCAADANYRAHCLSEGCLHFSLRYSGDYLSPLALIGGLNPSRLLPISEI
ncbi:MAG: hypothetical protein RLZZ258_329 [Actinomycetota bacterium]|jgi:murein DD-endopeptidase MepM/ murein hydrolase activator NlpD